MRALSSRFRDFLKKVGPSITVDLGTVHLENTYYAEVPHHRKIKFITGKHKSLHLYPLSFAFGYDNADPNSAGFPSSFRFNLNILGFSYCSDTYDDDFPRFLFSVEYEHKQIMADLFWMHIKEWRDEDDE